VNDDAANPKFSDSYSNEWIVKHRFQPSATLFRLEGEKLVELPYPPTNMVLVGEKALG
jgi:hypothetical protein